MRSPLILLQKSFTPKIIGVVNLTKHSFSQDGVITKSAREVKINRVLSYAGGVDLGGECSGPGAPIINAEREKRSIRAALRIVNSTAKKQHPNAIISVDTRRPEIAHLALSEGANMINDVSGGRGVAPPRNKRCSKKKERSRESELPTDYSKMTSKTANTDSSGILNESMLNMFEVIREFPFASLVIMYSPRMHGLCSDPLCEEPTTDNTLRFFDRQLELAARNGVSSQSQIILDPGLGRFLSQDSDVSVRVIVETIPKIQERFPGHRLFLGASRKGFLDNLAGRPTFPQDRVGSSLAMLAICQDLNVDFVRLHDVEWAHDFLKVRENFRCEETVQNVE